MSGKDVVFVGEAMTAVVHGVSVVSEILGCRPVIVGGLAVLSRLSRPPTVPPSTSTSWTDVSGRSHTSKSSEAPPERSL